MPVSAPHHALRPAAYGRALLDMLDEAALFSGLAWTDIELIGRYVSAVEAPAGEVLFQEGESGDRLYILVRGRVETWKRDEADHRAAIASDGAGKSIGEMALIDGEPRSATCVVREPSVLVSLTRENFERLGREHPAVAYRVMSRVARLVSQRLRATSGRLVEFLHA